MVAAVQEELAPTETVALVVVVLVLSLAEGEVEEVAQIQQLPRQAPCRLLRRVVVAVVLMVELLLNTNREAEHA